MLMNSSPNSSNEEALSNRPWLKNPIIYLNQRIPILFSVQPDINYLILSQTPSLFECRISVPGQPSLVTQAIGSKKKDAENYAAVNMCRLLDAYESSLKEGAVESDPWEVALRELPEDSHHYSWFDNTRQYFSKYICPDTPIILVEQLSDFYLTKFSARTHLGIGCARNKKDSLKLAIVDAILKHENPVNLTNSLQGKTLTNSKKTNSIIAEENSIELDNVPKIMKTQLVEYKNEIWYNCPLLLVEAWSSVYKYGKHRCETIKPMEKKKVATRLTFKNDESIEFFGEGDNFDSASQLAAYSCILGKNIHMDSMCILQLKRILAQGNNKSTTGQLNNLSQPWSRKKTRLEISEEQKTNFPLIMSDFIDYMCQKLNVTPSIQCKSSKVIDKTEWNAKCLLKLKDEQIMEWEFSGASELEATNAVVCKVFIYLAKQYPEALNLFAESYSMQADVNLMIEYANIVIGEKDLSQIDVNGSVKSENFLVFDWDSPEIFVRIDEKSAERFSMWLQEKRNVGSLKQAIQTVESSMENSIKTGTVSEDLEMLRYGDITPSKIEEMSARIKRESEAFRKLPQYEAIDLGRQKLPAYVQRQKLNEALESYQVIIVSGPAGSGKSTQLPNTVLEDVINEGCGAQCNILVTEPRRIAAISLAKRVAEERGEPLEKRVGYQVRFEKRTPEPFGGITYCTTGILLNKLRNNPQLYGYSHIFVDEAHERDLLCDFTLLLLRDLLKERPELRLVIMSASMEVQTFDNYFSQFTRTVVTIDCPPIPVKSYFLEDILPLINPELVIALDSEEFIAGENTFARGNGEDNDSAIGMPHSLLEGLIGEICSRTEPRESILVFLPGWEEINTLFKILTQEDILQIGYQDGSRFKFYLLHSQMRSFDQHAIFNVPDNGERKIILATNIAESSITIQDVVHVIDSAKVRISFFESEMKLRDLDCQWISHANSVQRQGRAGRVSGVGYYYCLMSRTRFELLPSSSIPEILRADLQEVCLLVKSLGLKGTVEDIFGKAIDAPETVSVRKAVQNLQDIGAFTETEGLTPLGHLLTLLPLSPNIGKMVLYGILYRCLDPILTIAAIMTVGQPFMSKNMLEHEDKESPTDPRVIYGATANESDHIAALNAFNDWRESRKTFASFHQELQYCKDHGVSLFTLNSINQLKKQISDVIEDLSLVKTYFSLFDFLTCPAESVSSIERMYYLVNENSDKPMVMKSVILVGLLPMLAVATCRNFRRLHTFYKESIFMHPSSINYLKNNLSEDTKTAVTIVSAFQDKIKTRSGRTFAFSTLTCEPFSLIMNSNSLQYSEISLVARNSTDLIKSIKERIASMEVMNWIRFHSNCEMDNLKLFKYCFDICLNYVISRLLVTRGGSSLSASPGGSPKKIECGDGDILRYVDSVIRSCLELIEESSCRSKK